MVSVGSSTQGPEWGCGVHSSVGSTRTQAWVGGCTSSDLPCILSLQPKAMLYLLPPPHLTGKNPVLRKHDVRNHDAHTWLLSWPPSACLPSLQPDLIPEMQPVFFSLKNIEKKIRQLQAMSPLLFPCHPSLLCRLASPS